MLTSLINNSGVSLKHLKRFSTTVSGILISSSSEYLYLAVSVTEHFTKFLIDLQFHIRLHRIIICFDLDMDFLLDNNMVTAIVMINELIHPVKLYYATVIDCEQNV